MKKSNNINRYRFIFFEIGLIVALSLSLMAFKIKGYEGNYLTDHSDVKETEIVQIFSHIQKPPAPKKTKPQLIRRKRPDTEDLSRLKLVDDKIKLVEVFDNKKPEPVKLNKVEFVSHRIVQPVTNEIVESPDYMAEFPGGQEALLNFLRRELKYPEIAKEVEAEGLVWVSFVVDKKGEITQIKIEKDAVGYGCGSEAVRVVRKMPKWKPGTKNGMPVRTLFKQGFRFELSD